MAKGKLTPESKAEFAKKLALNRAKKLQDKAKKLGIDVNVKVKGRSADQIMKDIEKAKADPKFMKKQEALAKKAVQKTLSTAAKTAPKSTPRSGGLRGGGRFGGGGAGAGGLMGSKIR